MLIPMLSRFLRFVLSAVTLAGLTVLPIAMGQPRRAPAPKSLRLYVLDCGKIRGVGAAAFGFKKAPEYYE